MAELGKTLCRTLPLFAANGKGKRRVRMRLHKKAVPQHANDVHLEWRMVSKEQRMHSLVLQQRFDFFVELVPTGFSRE